ncbi:MAG: PEPxxWA-CTERM sorting domain-containing protein [Phenylobacterium sp.]
MTPRKKAVHRVAKARPAAPRMMVALAPTPPLIVAGGRSKPMALALHSEGCDKNPPATIMSPIPGVTPNGPPPSPLETVFVPVPPPSGDMGPQTWVVTDRPVPPSPEGGGGGGGGVPTTTGGGGGGGVFPPGVPTPSGVPTAVPEPGTWAMMLAGFLSIGAALRRNRATARRLDKSPAEP